jgi:hypothetical protein
LIEAAAQRGIVTAVGVAALVYLLRRPRGPARARLPASIALAVAVGVLLAWASGGLALPRVPAADALVVVAVAMLRPLAEELVFRGVIQRSLEATLARRGLRGARILAGAASVAVSLVATGGAVGASLAVVAAHTAAAGVQVITGRTLAAWLVRAVVAALAGVAAAASVGA